MGLQNLRRVLTPSPTPTRSNDQSLTNTTPSIMHSIWPETTSSRSCVQSSTPLPTILAVFQSPGCLGHFSNSPLSSFHPLSLPQQSTTRFHLRKAVSRDNICPSLKISNLTRRFPLPGPNSLIRHFSSLHHVIWFVVSSLSPLRCDFTGF
jgi:hypothetical protein